MGFYSSIITRKISEKWQHALNFISGIVSFTVSLGIGFFLSRYIVSVLGVEAAGFIVLGGDFIAYAGLIGIALNSVSGRFVSYAYHKNDIEGANKYYSVFFYSNIVLAAVIAIVAVPIVMNLERIIIIPPDMLTDVRLLFSLLFLKVVIVTVYAHQDVGVITRNRLDLANMTSITSLMLKVSLLVVLFTFMTPMVSYQGLATLAASALLIAARIKFNRYLISEIKPRLNNFSLKALWEMLSSGFWLAAVTGGAILLNGLNVLIANIFIGPTAMGILALAALVPITLSRLAGNIAHVFFPAMVEKYAKNDIELVQRELRRGMKLTGITITIPLAVIFVFGREFFALWLPYEDAVLLHTLAILTAFSLVFTAGTQCLDRIFRVVNKLRTYSLIVLLSGLSSVAVVLLLLNVGVAAESGLYVIAATGAIFILLRELLFVVPFSAKYLGLKWYTFFPEVMYTLLSSAVLVFLGIIVRQIVILDSWFTFLLACFILAASGGITNMFIILNKGDRKYLFSVVLKVLKLGRKAH